MKNMKDYLEIAKQAAVSAATMLQQDFLSDAFITDNSGKDIKTKADLASQALILKELEPTGIAVLAEEQAIRVAMDINVPLWIVDPLDGTLNFSREFAMAAVSIALWDKGEPVLGVVHDIFHDCAYCGIVGEGAWCNDRRVTVSSVDTMSSAILATGFPSGRSYDTDSLLAFVRSVQIYKKVRMLGSAALMLAHVAAGHFDVYEEEDIYLWDVAAGLALVHAAGGNSHMQKGSSLYKYNVRAQNGRL